MTGPVSLASVAQALAEVARPIILDSFSADSCIVSTRAAVEVLAAYGFTPEPVQVTALVMNRAATMAVDRWGFERASQIMSRYSAEERGGPWVVGVGFASGDDRPMRWPGHLIAAVTDGDDDTWLVDLSLDQAARPHKRLVVEPLAAQVPTGWGDGVALALPDGGVVQYRHAAHSADHTTSPNWDLDEDVVAETVARVRQAVADLLGAPVTV